MMLHLLLLMLEYEIYDCSANDTPFIINRATNRVEFSDLLLEYNHNHADSRSVEVTISFAVRYIHAYSNTLALSCEIFQQWQDSRLKYSGATSVPNDIKIWVPDTSFVNSGATYGLESSIRLYSNGMICQKQRVILNLPCISESFSKQNGLQRLNCSVVIGSFDNAGVESIIYTVGNITLQGNSDQYNVFRSLNYAYDTFNETALNGELLHRTAIHFLVESDEITRFFNRTEF